MVFTKDFILNMFNLCVLCYESNTTIKKKYLTIHKDLYKKNLVDPKTKYSNNNNNSISYYKSTTTNTSTVLYKCSSIPTIKSSPTDCQYFTTYYDDLLIVCFRGTESKKDILIDLTIDKAQLHIPNYNTKLYVHRGFLNQFNDIKDDLKHEIKIYNTRTDIKEKKIIFTGHSLGGALATIGTCYYGVLYPKLSINCITLGSPKVGCNTFINVFNKGCTISLRFINGKDPIPALFSSWRKHVNGTLWISNNKLYNTNIRDNGLLTSFFKNCVNYLIKKEPTTYNDHKCISYITNLNNIDF